MRTSKFPNDIDYWNGFYTAKRHHAPDWNYKRTDAFKRSEYMEGHRDGVDAASHRERKLNDDYGL